MWFWSRNGNHLKTKDLHPSKKPGQKMSKVKNIEYDL